MIPLRVVMRFSRIAFVTCIVDGMPTRVNIRYPGGVRGRRERQ